MYNRTLMLLVLSCKGFLLRTFSVWMVTKASYRQMLVFLDRYIHHLSFLQKTSKINIMPNDRRARMADRLRRQLDACGARDRMQGVMQGVSISPFIAAIQGILGNEFMRGLMANQREAKEGGEHHKRFDRPFVPPPVDTPGQIMTLVIGGPTTFLMLNSKLGGVDQHGLMGDGPRGQRQDCSVALLLFLCSIWNLDDGRIDIRKMLEGLDCLLPIMGNRVVFEDLSE
jgi:hypothetical protein